MKNSLRFRLVTYIFFGFLPLITSGQAPVLGEAQFVSHNGLMVSWNGMTGVTSYRVDISSDNFITFANGFENYEAVINTPTTGVIRWNFIGLQPETNYKIRVRAEIGGSLSSNSNIVLFTTHQIPPQASPLLWQSTFESDGSDQVTRMTIGTDGFLYVVGSYQGDLSIEGNQLNGLGERDGYIAKYTASGQLQWAKAIQGMGNEEIWAVATDNHSLYLYGIFDQTINVNIKGGVNNLTPRGLNTGIFGDRGDGFLASYSLSDLTLNWAITLGDASPITGNPIQSDGTNLFLTGTFYRTNDFDAGLGVYSLTSKGDDDVFIASYVASNGDLNWAKNFGGNLIVDWGYSILIQGSHLYACGIYIDGVDLDPGPNVLTANDNGGFFSKFNKNDGSLVWAKAIAGGAGTSGNVLDMVNDDNALYISGDFGGIVDFDPGPGENFKTSNGNSDGFFGKYSLESGDLIWVRTMTGSATTTNDLSLRKIVIDNSSLYIGGNSSWSADFNDGDGEANRTSFGNDVFLASYQKVDGSFNWAKTIGGSSDFDFMRGGLAIGNDGLYLGSRFSGFVKFDPYQGQGFATGSGDYSAVLKYALETTPPNIPTGLEASMITSSSVMLRWDEINGASSYRLDLSRDNFSTFVNGLNNRSVSGTRFAFKNLEPGTNYKFRIRAVNSAGISPNSVDIQFKTKGLQTINFPLIVDQQITNKTFVLNGTATSGLPVSFEATSPDKINIVNNVVTLLKPGVASVKASQMGDSNFEAAPIMERTFCILPPKPSITLTGQTPPWVLSSSSAADNQWRLAGSLIGRTSQTISVTEPGSYSVMVVVEGCQSELSNPIQLMVTGDIDLPDEALHASPNPATSYVQLSGLFDSLIVRNLMGQEFSVKTEGRDGLTTLDISDLPVGLYIISVVKNNSGQQIKLLKL
jgi:Fibronectin type III domain